MSMLSRLLCQELIYFQSDGRMNKNEMALDAPERPIKMPKVTVVRDDKKGEFSDGVVSAKVPLRSTCRQAVRKKICKAKSPVG
jgi:hypothetical protein